MVGIDEFPESGLKLSEACYVCLSVLYHPVGNSGCEADFNPKFIVPSRLDTVSRTSVLLRRGFSCFQRDLLTVAFRGVCSMYRSDFVAFQCSKVQLCLIVLLCLYVRNFLITGSWYLQNGLNNCWVLRRVLLFILILNSQVVCVNH